MEIRRSQDAEEVSALIATMLRTTNIKAGERGLLYSST